eukprot:g1586.t1
MSNSLDKEVAENVAVLRRTFLEGKTRSLSHRRSQLLAFKEMMTVEADRFAEALYSDLKKHEEAAFNFEISVVQAEIQKMLDHLDEWAAPESSSMGVLDYPVIWLTGGGQSKLYRDPLGVILIIGAWNYPIHLTLAPLAGAIAGGNTVLIKNPSPKYSPACDKLMAELIPKYLDSSCVKVVQGGREGTQAALNPANRYDLIFFTGGTFVGKKVAAAAAENLTPTVLELGGQNPVIIDQTADLLIAAKRCMWGKVTNAGQTCVGTNHLYVHEAVADEFIEKCKLVLHDFFGSDAQKSKSFPRIVNGRAHRRLSEILELDKKYIVAGGDRDESDLYIAPTLLDFGTDEAAFDQSACMEDEIFGPMVPILRFTSHEKVVKRIQKAEKPLSLYVFSNDSSVSELYLKNTSSGQAVVNDMFLQFAAPLPFGGVGRSGMGSYHGKWSFKTFTHEKAVLKRHSYLEIPARFPPYGVPWKKFLVRLLVGPYSSGQVQIAKVVVFALFFSFMSACGGTTMLRALLKKLLSQAIYYL